MTMALPAPHLDDRRFQDLVDEAKRFVQQRCPEWSDHNLSDPGVTLIEVFAQMADEIIYRLNRVPDRHYVSFLSMIGLRRFPPAAATVPVTFWLAAVPEEAVRLPAGVVVATRRTEVDDAIEFTTREECAVLPVRFQSVRASLEEDRTRAMDEELVRGQGFSCFASPPVPGNALYVGLTDAAPGNALVIELSCTIEGIGVDPEFPPLVWEAWTGDGWERCDVDRDTTGGLNRDGRVVVHLPRRHEASVISRVRAGWVRARVVTALENQPMYSSSPLIRSISAHTIGVTTEALQARIVAAEELGASDGTPGQRFPIENRPVVRSDGAALEVSDEHEGWHPWTEVAHFADSGPDDRHYVLDGVDGVVEFGPAVREPDGSLRRHGAVPRKGTQVRLRHFAVGGGVAGNVSTRAVQVLVSSFPGIDRVENRRPGVGGREAETVDEAKARGPLMLRSRGRAVTAEDFEELSKEAAPEAARIRCVPAGGDGPEAGAVRMLVVPNVASEAGRLPFERLVPPAALLQRIAEALDRKRLVGTRVSVEPPVFQGITVVARIRARPGISPARLQEQALTALFRYFHPIEGGPDGTGWPFGRPVLLGEVSAVLQRVPGVELVDDARLFAADPITGDRGQSVPRIDISANALVYSFDHQVVVEAS
jgi:predicted phage baseplate assembly protein